MGTVFEALEEKMNRRVALKLLSRSLSQSERAGDRFARESWIAGKLSHPNLVKVFERGEHEGVAFFSMELVDGGSLHDVIRNLKVWGEDETWKLKFGSRTYIPWAMARIIAAAQGLDYAHRQGVIHRDIKPMNILLNRDPAVVKVADFGLAVDTEATRVTTIGTVMGTVAYMAPEQIRGQRDRIGPWTDVYSLGVTLFELLTLDLPFSGETQQLYLNAVLSEEAKRPRKLNERVSRDLEVILRKALEKDPEDRYRSAAAFAEDLENVLQFRPIRARPPGAGLRVLKWARRRPMHATLAAILALGAPTVSFLSYRAIEHRRLVEHLQTEQAKEEVRKLNHDNRFRQALPLLDQILFRLPQDEEMLRTRAITRYRLSEVETDRLRRAELQRLALADASRLVDLDPAKGWPYRLRAFLLRQFGESGEAERDERRAARYRSSAPSTQDRSIDGYLALTAGEYEKAARLFSEIITRQADSADARLWRASAYELLGQGSVARTDYEVAVALKPSDPVARVGLARLMDREGDLDRGSLLLRQALEIDPESAPAYENLADNLIRRGKAMAASGDTQRATQAFQEAEAAARHSLRLDPERAWAHLNLGVALVERNRLLEAPDPRLLAQAAEEYEKVIASPEAKESSAPDGLLDTALVNQCDVLIQLQDLGRALDACRAIAKRRPENPNNHYNLAAVYALSHLPEEALRSLEEDFALGDRDYQYLSTDRWFVSLQGDRRFASLLERMKKALAPSKP
jgi:tetratricopeptide (TPR) repeat protein